VRCATCQQENPATAKFCLACGEPLRSICTQCGTELPGYARFCTECGHPTTPANARPAEAPTPSTERPDVAVEPAAAGPGRVVVERSEVLHALYEQGRSALRRGDATGAAIALAAVVEEAPNTYPDAHRLLAEALRGSRGGPAGTASRWLSFAPALAVAVRDRTGPAAATVAAEWLVWARALWDAGLRRVRGGRPAPAMAVRWRDPAPSRLAAMRRREAFPTWAVTFAVVLILGVMLAQRAVEGGPHAVGAEAARAVPAVEATADLAARCQAAVDAADWAEAIRACRVLHARAPDADGLPDDLVAAYVGRGQQRLAGDDLAAAAADFRQALSYEPESTAAQTAAQRLTLYQAGDKALGSGDWEKAVAQFGAAYAEAPDYLQNLDDRSLKGKLFAAWLAWGQSALNADAPADAAQRCGQALALVPDDADAERCIAAAQDLDAAAVPLVAAERTNG
jgi:tetratricopeptide (TPR) repeat protein